MDLEAENDVKQGTGEMADKVDPIVFKKTSL